MDYLKKVLILLTVCIGIVACEEEPKQMVIPKKIEPKPARAVVPQPEWIKSANMYTVNLRHITPEGTIKSFQKMLPQIKDMGVDILRMMPVQPIGVKNRQGTLGNYYSIYDYGDVNPEYGTFDEFKAFVEKAHELGFKVILDWQPNSTAFDNIWVEMRPDFYTGYSENNFPVLAKDNDGKPLGRPDAADLNYEERDLLGAMIEAMRDWVAQLDVDGFYCVDAQYVPQDFWEIMPERIKQTKQDLLFISDFENTKQLETMNMVAGNTFYETIFNVANKKQSITALDDYVTHFYTQFLPTDVPLYFTSGPFLNAFDGSATERFGQANNACFVLATTFINGMPVLFGGQENGLDKNLNFFEKDYWDGKSATQKEFYKQMFALKHQNPAIFNGAYGGSFAKVTTDKPEEVYAFAREKETNTVLVFINFSAQPVSVIAQTQNHAGVYQMHGLNQTKEVAESTTLELPAWGYTILTKK